MSIGERQKIMSNERTSKMKQIAVIKYGGGINLRYFVEQEKRLGHAILLCEGHCEVYATPSQPNFAEKGK